MKKLIIVISLFMFSGFAMALTFPLDGTKRGLAFQDIYKKYSSCYKNIKSISKKENDCVMAKDEKEGLERLEKWYKSDTYKNYKAMCKTATNTIESRYNIIDSKITDLGSQTAGKLLILYCDAEAYRVDLRNNKTKVKYSFKFNPNNGVYVMEKFNR